MSRSLPAVVGALLVALILSTGPAAGADPWSAEGTSTYEGSWTLTVWDTDTDAIQPPVPVGDSLPGELRMSCVFGPTGPCSFEGSRDGVPWWVAGVDPFDEGVLRGETENRLDNCGTGQLQRTVYDATIGPEDATASIAQTTDPRTCEDGTSTLYTVDSTWTFSGVLVDFVPAAAPAEPSDSGLADYLASYGLVCAAASATETRCDLELTDDDGLDATYSVVTRTDDEGELVSIDATVTSLDESMPSDAIGFLRGVAERAPVADASALTTWLDAAVIDPSQATFDDGSWQAAWADTVVGDGRALALTILRPDAVGSPSPSDEPDTAPMAPAPGATPSRPFGESVATVDEVSTDPIVLLQSAALALLVVLLMPFPGQLFNSTLEAHEDEVRRWFRLDRIGSAVGRSAGFWTTRPGVATFVVLATLLYGFLDPGFGLNEASAPTFVGILLGIVVVTAAFAIPAILAHRRSGDRPTLRVVPLSLVIGVACVLISRATGFQPGYLYGLLIGLVFARELSAAEEGKATAIGAVLMLAVALVAWLGLGALPDGDGFGQVVTRTVLAALMVAGLEGVVFGLLPMRFLPGAPLYAWNRMLWAALLGLGAFAFFHILINPASGYLSDTSRTPLFTVIALLLGFSLVSVAFWAWFRFRDDGASVENAKTSV